MSSSYYKERYKERIKNINGSSKSSVEDNAKTSSTSNSTGGNSDTEYYKKRYKERVTGINKNGDKKVDDNYIKSFLSDADKYLKSAEADYNSLGYGTASDIYKTRLDTANDLQHRSFEIAQYLENNKDRIDDETFNNFKSYLDEFDKASSKMRYEFYNAKEYYSDMGWLNPDAEYSPEAAQARKERYQGNESRIAELEEAYKIAQQLQERERTLRQGYARGGYGATYDAVRGTYTYSKAIEDKVNSDSVVIELRKQLEKYGGIDSIKTEMESLKAENNKYMNLQGKRDEHYIPITDEVKQTASNRDYSNASMEDLNIHDAGFKDVSKYLGDGVHYLDDDGNVVNSYTGKVVRPADEYSKVMLNNDTEGFYNSVIQDKLGMFFSASEDDLAEAYNRLSASHGNTSDVWANTLRDGDVNGWKQLTDDEITIYYYKLNTEGQESAYKFLEDMTTELTRRETEKRAKEIGDAGWLEQIALNIASVPMNVLGGAIGFVDDASNIVQGDDINPYSRAHSWQNDASAIRTDTAMDIDKLTGGVAIPLLDFSVGDAYQALMSGADSFAGSFLGGTGYGVLMGMGAASAEMKELYERGASTEQMFLGGILAGAAEMVFEKYSIDKFVEMGDTKSKRDFIINLLKQGGVEASEEAFTEIANTITDAIVMGSQAEVQDLGTFVKNVVNAGLGGFLSGGGMGAVGSTANYVQYAQKRTEHGQDIIDNGGVDTLRQLALDMAGVTQKGESKNLTRLAGKVEKNASAKNVGKLSAKMENTITNQNRTDIQKALVEKGLSEKDAKRVAEYLGSTEALTEEQRAEVEGNENIKAVVDELLKDSKSDISERGRNLIAARLGVDIKNAKVNASNSGELTLRNDVDVKERVSETGKTTLADTGEVITIDKKNPIAKVKYVDEERVVYFNTDHGTVEASKVKYANEEEGLIYEAFTDMNPAFANAVIKNYDGSVPIQTYINGMREGMILYGMHNFQAVGKDISKNSFLADLSETDQAFALKLGRAYAKADAKNANKDLRSAIKKAAEKAKTAEEGSTSKGTQNKAKKGRVYFEDGAKVETHKQHRKIVALAKHLANAIGIDIVFYDSRITGKKAGQGANGYFDADTDTIYLDLQNAEDDAKTITYTLSHELVHFIKKWSPQKFNTFAEFLMEQYASHGVSAANLLKQKMVELNTTDADLAYEEMIADACETMLLDSNAVVKLMELRKSDLELFEKIKLHILKILNDIREAYKSLGYQPSSDEAKALLGMKDVLEKFYSMFEEAAVDATKNYQANYQAKAGKERVEQRYKRQEKPRSAQAQRDAGYMLSESKFYQLYSAHKLTYGNRGGEINSVIEKIKRDGFISTTSNSNILPTSTMRYFHYDRDGKVKFTNIVQARYAPKKGDYILFVPNNYVTKDDIIKNGFKPLDYEIGVVEYDYQPYYELYEKTYKQHEELNSGSIKRQAKRDAYASGEYREPINIADVKALKAIAAKRGKISLKDLSDGEIEALQKWAYKYWSNPQTNTKSPFFRAWFGDWRESTKFDVEVVDTKSDNRKDVVNEDTGWTVKASRQVHKETSNHKGSAEVNAVKYLPYIDDITKKAILFDSVLSDKDNENSLMFHTMYAYTEAMGYPALLKLKVEELFYFSNTESGVFQRDYILQNIEEESLSKRNRLSRPNHLKKDSSVISIAELYDIVKRYEKNFKSSEVSKVVNLDGTPMIVYHGSSVRDIEEFKTTNANGTGGLYLSTNRKVAEGFAGEDGEVYETYVNLRNPLIIDANGAYYDSIAIPTDMVGSSYAFGSNTVDTNAIAAYARANNYDGVIIKNVREVSGFGDDIIAFESTQVKSATDNIGTFDGNNSNIHYQKKQAQGNVGYHAGDLGKAEYYHQQGYGRGTGHFGTGTYFVGNEEKISGDNTYGKRPHHAVDFSNYNLYKIKYEEDGYKLHEQLRVIDGGLRQDFYEKALDDEFSFYPYVSVYELADKKYKTKSNTWEEAYIPAWQDIAKERGIEYQSEEEWSKENNFPTDDEYFADYYSEYLEKAVKEATEAVEQEYRRFRDAYFHLWLRFGSANTRRAIQKTIFYQKEINPKGTRDYFAEKDKKADSLATFFMKSLGYEGIDVRGTRLDNVEYGSVIYDLKEDSVLYQKKKTSNRTILANALDTTAQNDIEKNKLAQYKEKIALIESEEEKLAELRGKIKELSFAPGRRDTEAIKKLQFEANQTANRINTYDRQLLNLESTMALKGVLEREKQMAYKRAEQKGKEALDAYREKMTKTQRELLTRYQDSRKKGIEGRNKTEMRHKIKKVVGDLKALLLDPTKDKHVPIGLQKPVAEALDIINMDTVGADERVAKYNALIAKAKDPDVIAELTKSRDRIALQGENLSDKLTALKLAYAEIKNSDDPLISNSHNEAIEDLIANTAEKVGSTTIRDMSYEQLEAVYDMYKAVLATVRNANKMFKADKQETITDNSELVKREVRAAGGHRDRVLKATKWLKKFGWNMLKPIYAMKMIGSNTLTRLYENVRKGEDTWAVDVNEARKFFRETARKYNYNSWDFKKQYSFKDSAGNSFSLSVEQIMSLYAYSKRNQADKHLEFGGFIFDDAIEITEKNKLGIPMKYEVNDANPYRLKKGDLGEIISILDTDLKEVKGFVDEMQAYLSDVMGAKGNEVSLAMYDIKLYKEKNYFPLKTAKYFREFDPEKNGTPKIKNSGFSKKTVPQAGNPIILSNFMDVWANHVNDMSMYHAFVLPLEDFMRVYNYSSTAGGYDSVQQYIKNAYGSQANSYIETLMNDLNGGARTDPSADVISKGLSLFKKAKVFASLSVVVQQPSAIARATAYIDAKYFVDKPNADKHSETWAEVKKYAPVAIIKEMGYFDTNMGRSTVDFITSREYNGIKEKFGAMFTDSDYRDEVLSKAPALADELAWCAIWKAVKRETLHTHPNLRPNSEEFLKAAGERFTEVITKTQVYDSVLSRSAMMRSKDTGMKMATAFMAEPTTSLNMAVDAIIEGKRGNKAFTRKALGAVAASVILNSILVSIVYAWRDDDEDETYTEKYLESLTTELIDGFNPLTYVPFVKDMWSIMQGFDIERSDMSLVADLWASIENLFSENKSGFEKVEGVVGNISSVFGLPVANIMRDARGMYNLATTLTSGIPTTKAGVGDAVVGAVKNSIPLYSRIEKFVGADDSKSDKLYDAIISGDQKHTDRMKSQYKDDKAIESAIRKGIRENDPRIKEAAEARYNGDISEYMRIAKEIIAEGHFKQDDIVAAINSEINTLKKGEGTTESSAPSNKVTSIYKVDDFYAALVDRDQATAYVVKEDLIKTDVANGKDRDEAEKDFNEDFTDYVKKCYVEDEISDYEAKNMLINYADKSEEVATSKVKYWAFKKEYPDINVDDSWITEYYADGVSDSGISVKMFVEYRNEVKGITGEDKKARRMAVINSLPISSAQKDALYFAEGWTSSKLWEAPWH